MRIPFCDKGQQASSEAVQVGEIEHAESFALQDAEPLLDLIHPGTVCDFTHIMVLPQAR